MGQHEQTFLPQPRWRASQLRLSYGQHDLDLLVALAAGAPGCSLLGTRRLQRRDPCFPNFVAYHQPSDGLMIGFSFWPLHRGDRDVARRAVETLSELDAAPRFNVPQLQLSDASIVEIIGAAQQELPQKPTKAAALWNAASPLLGPGNDPEGKALGLWRQCLDAGEPGAHLRIGTCLLKRGRVQEAERHLREFTKVLPFDPEGWWYLGRSLERLGRRDQARPAFRSAVENCAKLNPPLVGSWLEQQIQRDYLRVL